MNPTTEKLSNAQIVVLDKEMGRILQRMNAIKSPYSGTLSMTDEDRAALIQLRQRLNELKAMLGVKY